MWGLRQSRFIFGISPAKILSFELATMLALNTFKFSSLFGLLVFAEFYVNSKSALLMVGRVIL